MTEAELKASGERQVANTMSGISEDHVRRYAWVVERLEPDTTVLDAGCGVGYGSCMLAERAAKVVAVDLASEAIQYAQRFWSHPSNLKSVFWIGKPRSKKSGFWRLRNFYVREEKVKEAASMYYANCGGTKYDLGN